MQRRRAAEGCAKHLALLHSLTAAKQLGTTRNSTSSTSSTATSHEQNPGSGAAGTRSRVRPPFRGSRGSLDMFKKFEVSGTNQVKSSVARGIRSSVAEQYPWLEQNGVLDVLLPKKEPMYVAKCPNYMQVAIIHNVPLFFSEREGRWFPTLRVLHQYPDMMPKLRCDKGAIKFVLSGANIMCPGLTSPGATIHDEVAEGAPVAIYAEEKEHAMAVGYTKLSTEDIRSVNKGVAVELMHHLNDGLWKQPTLA